jgi:SAM-dependent methyltransferase
MEVFLVQKGDYAKHAAVWDWSGHDRTGEVDLWLNMAQKYGTRVLAAMCATGQVASGLAENGMSVTAVDMTAEMIAEGRERHGRIAGLEFVQANVCGLDLPRKNYDFAFLATSDIHHLPDSPSRDAALASLGKHIRSGGGLGLEMWYPKAQSYATPWREFRPLTAAGAGGPMVWKRGRTEYDAQSMRVTITQEVHVESGGLKASFPHVLSLQLFERSELQRMLIKAGFELAAEYGSPDFDSWHPESSQWIVEARKL